MQAGDLSKNQVKSRWQVWIDRGGTFTDCIAVDPRSNEIRIAKVLSSDRAPLVGIRKLLHLGPEEPIPACDVRMGTTIATNALLERKGAECGLLTNRGLEDALFIGTQARPALFALRIVKPTFIAHAVCGLGVRRDHRGAVLDPLDEAEAEAALRELQERGCRSVAVVFLHAHADDSDELRVVEMARSMGFDYAVSSAEAARQLGLVARGDTAVVDGYLTPLLAEYVRSLLAELPGSHLRIMQSSGGLAWAEDFRGRDAILSGPAGGVVALGHVAAAAGFDRAIGFDMGGTSTDVSRWAGEPERIYESEVSGVRIRTPMMDIHTVAAGGGSVCRVDGARLTVGPDSAGSDPGPLCYGRPAALELTLTDVLLILGRIRPELFPLPLDSTRPTAVLDAQLADLGDAFPHREALAHGYFEVAVDSMAEAIRRISVARGHDVRTHALVVFGGAGGQAACALARRLDIRDVLIHPLAGVLSALGMGLAPVTRHAVRDGGRRALPAAKLETTFAELRRTVEQQMAAEGVSRADIEFRHRVDLRYRGTDTSLTIDADEQALEATFHEAHQRRFGYARRDHPIEVVSLRVDGASRLTEAPSLAVPPDAQRTKTEGRLFIGDQWVEGVPIRDRGSVGPGRHAGPLIIVEPTSCIVVEPGFDAELRGDGTIHLRHRAQASDRRRSAPHSKPDPVTLEIMGNAIMSIAEQMGAVLRNTSMSTNIRERLDFSCAVFDGDGGLVANAPHIPVHLGAMGQTVASLVRERKADLRPGRVFVSNDPYAGGSHLPDITVVMPVFVGDGETPEFFVGSRGHHADIGGITPGSMPPDSSQLFEEGIVFHHQLAVDEGRFLRQELVEQLSQGPYPARDPEQNVADLEAQIAADQTGQRLLRELCAKHGLATVVAYMRHIRDDAAHRVRAAIRRLGDGRRTFVDAMDDGNPITVTVTIADDALSVDFTGTGPQSRGNLNAPRAVTVAAVLYVLRCLVDAPIPLNDGCLEPVELNIPPGTLLDPEPGRAVCGGNVETSQRVVDVLLGALDLAAASQGTMNNVTFGQARFGYYETLGGGSGATAEGRGADAVHCHMTNTRLTDPEVLEARYPVRVTHFGIRRGSGGRGTHRGGDGLVRELEFLEPVDVSLLTERRLRQPFGLHGGEPGATGQNYADETPVPGRFSGRIEAGARLRIETPGGGGWGEP